jgi:Ca2+-binding EF-hand superfamily protein
MQATLTFDLTKDQHTFDCMMNALNMHSAIMELREHLRALDKYHDLTEDQAILIGDLRAWLQNELQDQGLSQLF